MKKLIFFCCLLLAPNLFALNLGEIRDEVRLRIKDVGVSGSRQRFTDAQLNDLINQTHRDVVNFTWVIKKSTDIESSVDTQSYALPTDYITSDRVQFRQKNIDETTTEALDGKFNNGSWRTSTGYPKNYYYEETDPGYIYLYPYPSSSASTGTITVEYVAQADTLSSDSDDPFNGYVTLQQYADLLIYEPCYKVFLIEGEGEKALEYRRYYESRLELMNSLIGKRPNYKPGFSSNRTGP